MDRKTSDKKGRYLTEEEDEEGEFLNIQNTGDDYGVEPIQA